MVNPVSYLKSITEGLTDPLDEIWNGPGINRQSVVTNFGLEFVAEINAKMPFLLRKKGGLPIDIAAADYGFESDQDLMDRIRAYIPKKERTARWERDYENYLSTLNRCPF